MKTQEHHTTDKRVRAEVRGPQPGDLLITLTGSGNNMLDVMIVEEAYLGCFTTHEFRHVLEERLEPYLARGWQMWYDDGDEPRLTTVHRFLSRRRKGRAGLINDLDLAKTVFA